VIVSTQPACAVVWVDRRNAVVALRDADGRETTCTISRGGCPTAGYLELVVRAIGDRERVVILGPGPARLDLERAYVAIYHRPDRLVDVEPSGPVAAADLVRRVRQLAA
jgi:hypothetical protein